MGDFHKFTATLLLVSSLGECGFCCEDYYFFFREFDLTIGVKDSFNFHILCIYIFQSIGCSKTLRIRISTLNYRKSLAKSRLVILFFQRFLSMFLPSYSRIYSVFLNHLLTDLRKTETVLNALWSVWKCEFLE